MGYDRQLKRGALINLLGLVAKLAHPLLLVAIPWMFGTDVMGLYFLAVFLMDVVSYFIYSGFSDATAIFASKHVDHDDAENQRALYRVLANATAIPTAAGLAVAVLGTVGADAFVHAVYADKPELIPALRILVWTVPLWSLASVFIAATKAQMRMEYDVAINATFLPLGFLGLLTAAWWFDLGLVGLMTARLVTYGVALLLSLRAFAKHYDVRALLGAIAHFAWDKDMLRFVVPQNLNMTFNRYITRLDVLMLGAFGFSNHAIAFYSAGALITSNIREVKQIFTSILGPIIARHHAAGAPDKMTADLSKVTRWTTTLGAPIVLAALVLRNDLLRIIDAKFSGDTTFMAILLLPPFLSCAVGMAGNCIVWTRHSGWNLLNSVAVAVINTALNWVLIPPLGLTGAAIATAIASTIISIAQVVELYALEKTTIRPAAVALPWLGLAACGALIALWGDPATAWDTAPARIGFAVAVVALYFALMYLLRHPEVTATAHRLLRRTRR